MSGPHRESFTQTFFTAMLLRSGLVLGVMALAYAGAALGRSSDGAWAPFLGALAGLGLGVALARSVLRRTGAARVRPR